jgi:hypothetical protein
LQNRYENKPGGDFAQGFLFLVPIGGFIHFAESP